MDWVKSYVADNPTFYLDELQAALRGRFPDLSNVSIPTICRGLSFDCDLSRKRLSRLIKQASMDQVRDYFQELGAFYSAPDQLVFVDESSKDGRSAFRRYGYSQVSSPCLAMMPADR